MEIKLSKLKQSEPFLKELVKKELPAVTAFKLTKIIREIDKELKLFEEQRNNLVKKYGQAKEDNPDEIEVTKENLETFTEEIEKVLDLNVNVNIDKINIEEFGECKVSVQLLYHLDYIFN